MFGVCKRILLKVWSTRQDSYLTMMAYRATPLSLILSSPAELLNGQQIQTPNVSKQQLGDEQTRMAIQKHKEKSMDFYNRHNNRQHPHLHAGQKVYVQHEKTMLWEPGMIHHSSTSPRSYIVASESGSILRSSSDQLKETQYLRTNMTNLL